MTSNTLESLFKRSNFFTVINKINFSIFVHMFFCKLQSMSKTPIRWRQPLSRFRGQCTRKMLITQVLPESSELYIIYRSRTEIFFSCICSICSVSLAEQNYRTWSRIFIIWVGGSTCCISLVFAALHLWYTTGQSPTQMINILDRVQ